jgi:hypothetical protein
VPVPVPLSAPPVSVPAPVSVPVPESVVSELESVVLEVVPVLPDFFVDVLAASDPWGTVRAGFSRLVGFDCTLLLPQPESAIARTIAARTAGARPEPFKIRADIFTE